MSHETRVSISRSVDSAGHDRHQVPAALLADECKHRQLNYKASDFRPSNLRMRETQTLVQVLADTMQTRHLLLVRLHGRHHLRAQDVGPTRRRRALHSHQSTHEVPLRHHELQTQARSVQSLVVRNRGRQSLVLGARLQAGVSGEGERQSRTHFCRIYRIVIDEPSEHLCRLGLARSAVDGDHVSHFVRWSAAVDLRTLRRKYYNYSN